MPYANTQRASVHYTDSGGSGPVVVLAHGFLMDSSMFGRQEPLTDSVRLICWDARGHGQTQQKDTAEFSYWDLAADLLSVMDAADVESAVVGGMSQGGFSALRAALTAPERVAGLILIGTTARSCTPDESVGYKELFDVWCGAEPLEPIARSLAPQLIGGSTADQDPWVDRWMTSDRGRIRQAADCLMARDSVSDRLAEIDCPALIIRGADDHSFERPDTEELLHGLSGASEIVDVPGAGHAVNWTHPTPVNAALRGFIHSLN